ncbi:DUF1127 domain-containing protein [Pseudohoeflea sp. DP4N28-3]|uniref:DUF1127 domain-containing protein n=2 Tax=Pseudohoeflea coraliihabitans TaxID=2860393 RepID=A0ABS6WMD7_9HYPH|nr:DUF1127 domain-containing protein [Pseudohoeflea sp. DP4N28-3]
MAQSATVSRSPAAKSPLAGLTSYATRILVLGVGAMRLRARNRRAARILAEMTPEQLADIGLTRHDLAASIRAESQGDFTRELARRARLNAQSGLR